MRLILIWNYLVNKKENNLEKYRSIVSMQENNITPTQDEIVLYQSEDGNVKVDVLFQDETVWLTQEQMAMLFGKARSMINEHIQNIYQEGELQESNSMRKFGNSEFSMKPTNYYNLDVIISVGYRVNSKNATRFRQWANKVLKQYLIKGYAVNERMRKEQIDVDQATVSKWCTNSAQPNLENLMEVAKCLEVNVNELLRM